MPKEALDLENVGHADDADVDTGAADRGDALTVDDPEEPAATEPEADDDPAGEPAAKEPEPSDEPAAKKAGTGDEPAAKEPAAVVPRGRLTEAQHKRREAEARADAAEAELEALRQKSGQGKAFKEFTDKVDKLYEDVEVARAEGDFKKAAQMQRELDGMRDNANRARVEYLAQQKATQAQALAAYETVVDQVELLVPELNPGSDDFNEDMLEEVSAARDGFEAHGQSPADALKRALYYVLGRDVFDESAASLRNAHPAKKGTDVKKNIAAAKKTPPEMGASAPAEKPLVLDTSKLSDDEFDKLPEATRRRLRGDFL